jgi:hypothetical protein
MRAIAPILAVAAAAVLGAAAAPARPGGAALPGALPVVRIDAARPIPDARKLNARLQLPGYAGLVGIETRGHTSGHFPKRSYTLETRDAAGRSRNVALLGLPLENDWILYASYNDKTLIRNVVAHETAWRLGRYASRTRFIELVLNGRYHGVYVLMEKPKLDKHRVALDGSNVTGGYLLELTSGDKLRHGEGIFRLPVTRKPVEYADPDAGDLSAQRRRWIRAHVGECERRLYSPAWRDPAQGWRSCLDEGTAIDYVLVNELFKNQDAFQSSTFLSKGVGTKLRLGPVWDFDVSAGNSNYGKSVRVDGWMLADRHWVERLYGDRAFVDRLAARWRALRAQGLVQSIGGRIDTHTRKLAAAQARNFRRWPILGRHVWPNPVDPRTGKVRQTYAAEVAFLKSWLGRRVAWIDASVDELGR